MNAVVLNSAKNVLWFADSDITTCFHLVVTFKSMLKTKIIMIINYSWKKKRLSGEGFYERLSFSYEIRLRQYQYFRQKKSEELNYRLSIQITIFNM
jgi:hypothetical protein